MLKKSIYILSVVLLSYGIVLAQGRKGTDMPPPPPPQEEMNITFFEKAGIVLTDKQKDLIRSCSYKCNDDIKTYNLEMRKYMDQIREELMKEKPNRETLKTLIQKRKMIEADIEFLRIERDLTILETLTKEQKIKLDEFRNSYMSRRGHHGGAMMGEQRR